MRELRRNAEKLKPIEAMLGREVAKIARTERFNGYAAAIVQLETAVYGGVDPLVWLRRALAHLDDEREG